MHKLHIYSILAGPVKTVIVLVLLPLYSFTQSIELPIDFEEKLATVNLLINHPLDAGYEQYPVDENQYQNYDLSIKSKVEGMEIRYYVLPYSESDTLSMSPDVLCLRASTAIAVNDDEALMTMLRISRQELRESFGADWGILYFLTPKPGFSNSKFCRMLALHKEEVGSVLVFFLFDDPNNEAIDLRFPAVKFDKQ